MRTRWMLTITLLALLSSAALGQGRQGGLIPKLFKSGETTRTAFADTVAAAAKATVRVLCDGKPAALGTVVDADGFVLTKASELTGEKIECKLADGKTYVASVVGAHADTDLAMLKIDAKGLPAVSWGKGDAAVGQWLASAGTGKEPLAVGVVSVPKRAIPKQPGALGIRRDENDPTAKIAQVYPKSAAEGAGLKAGDIIIQLDGKKVETFEQLATTVRQHGPGDVLKLRVKRGEEEFDVSVELSPQSVLPMLGDNRGNIQNTMGGKLSTRRYGFASVIQHDTVLKPEDCGGPVVGLDGKVVGINIARGGRVESYALPVDVIQPLLANLKSGKLAPPKDLGKPQPVKAPEKPADKPAPAKPEAVKPEAVKPEPAKPEPAKPEPAKPEPAKPDGASKDPSPQAQPPSPSNEQERPRRRSSRRRPVV